MGRNPKGPGPSKDSLSAMLRVEREKRKLSLDAVAEAVGGITNQAISKIERGQTNPESLKARGNVIKLLQFYGKPVKREWMTGDAAAGDMISIKARVAAGDAVEFFLQGEDEDSIVVDSRLIYKKGKYFGLRVSGDSMEGAHVLSGDIVIVRYVPKTYQPAPTQHLAGSVDVFSYSAGVYHSFSPLLRETCGLAASRGVRSSK